MQNYSRQMKMIVGCYCVEGLKHSFDESRSNVKLRGPRGTDCLPKITGIAGMSGEAEKSKLPDSALQMTEPGMGCPFGFPLAEHQLENSYKF